MKSSPQKGVCWMEYGRTRGAMARFTHKNRQHAKFFSDKTKSKHYLMGRAFAWVLEEKEKLGVHTSQRQVRESYRGKIYGLPNGVTIYRDNRPGRYWFARCHAQIKPYSQVMRSFAFKKYGKNKAIRLAIKQRQTWESEILR